MYYILRTKIIYQVYQHHEGQRPLACFMAGAGTDASEANMDAATGEKTETAEQQSAAIRSYLNATITPVLLKGLMALDDEKPPCARLHLTACMCNRN